MITRLYIHNIIYKYIEYIHTKYVYACVFIYMYI